MSLATMSVRDVSALLLTTSAVKGAQELCVIFVREGKRRKANYGLPGDIRHRVTDEGTSRMEEELETVARAIDEEAHISFSSSAFYAERGSRHGPYDSIIRASSVVKLGDEKLFARELVGVTSVVYVARAPLPETRGFDKHVFTARAAQLRAMGVAADVWLATSGVVLVTVSDLLESVPATDAAVVPIDTALVKDMNGGFFDLRKEALATIGCPAVRGHLEAALSAFKASLAPSGTGAAASA